MLCFFVVFKEDLQVQRGAGGPKEKTSAERSDAQARQGQEAPKPQEKHSNICDAENRQGKKPNRQKHGTATIWNKHML